MKPSLFLFMVLIGVFVHLSEAEPQFRQAGNNQRFRFDSDEFDNDFDDLFDRRSRERDSFEFNSLERDSDEVFVGNFRRNNNAGGNRFQSNNNNNNNRFGSSLNLRRGDSLEVDRFGRVTIDRDSDEVFNSGFRRNNNNAGNRFQTNTRVPSSITSNLRRGDSLEVDRFGRVTIDRDSDEIFNSGFRRNNNNAGNRFQGNNAVTSSVINNLRRGDSLEVDRFGRVTIDRDSDERRNFGGANRNTFNRNNNFGSNNRFGANNAFNRNTNNQRNFGTANRNRFRDSDEVVIGNQRFTVDSVEVRNIGGNRNQFNANRNSFNRIRDDSIEVLTPVNGIGNSFIRDDSIEVVRPSTFNRNQNPFVANRNNNFFSRDDSIEVLTPVNQNTFNRNRNTFNRNQNTFRQVISIEDNSIENDSPEDFRPAFNFNNNRRPANPFLSAAVQNTNRFNNQNRNTFNNNNQNRNTFNNNNQNRNTFNNNNRASTSSFNANRGTSNTFSSVNQNRVNSNTFTSSNRNTGRPLSSTNTAARTNSARFPPLPTSNVRPVSNSRVNNPSVNTIVSNANINRNTNRVNLNTNNNRFNFNNPFLSRTSSSAGTRTNNNLRPIPSLPAVRAPAPVFPTTTRRPTTQRVTTPRPFVARPAPIRPSSIPSPPSRNSGHFNPFTAAAKKNNGVSSGKPSSNPFINKSHNRNTSNSVRNGNNKINSVGGFSRKKTTPRKPIAPMGFEWPGGNGYFFRMSTGNSKPIEYFISYDD